MPKVIILKGLPGSGKSTKAKEIMEKDGNWVRINKDQLRSMLHFDKWTGKKEDITRASARAIFRDSLSRNVNVIVDDTNLNRKTFQSWKDLATECGAKIEVIEIKTPLEECILRDSKREKKVGKSVIVGMALSSGLYPKPKNGVILCDLDGTLANIHHRLHLAKGETKNWKAFFEAAIHDTPRLDVMDMLLKHEEQGREIFIFSARPDSYRDLTETWLEKSFNGYNLHKALLMRRANDKRPDTEVKSDMLDLYFPDYSQIVEIIDDRPSVIRMWREKGLKVVDVGSSIEF